MTSRWPPLTPEFVIARGAAGRALAQSLLENPARLATLRGLVSGDVLALTGEDLPWVDGAEYFGRDGSASWLLVSTRVGTSVPFRWASSVLALAPSCWGARARGGGRRGGDRNARRRTEPARRASRERPRRSLLTGRRTGG